MIFREWKEEKIEDITVNYDKQRVPLSSMQRTNMKGKYPYYGAQGVIDYINDYIFEGKYLLIAEDGENLKSRKQNIGLLAYGKFWVNNHAHILKSNEKSVLEFLYYYINNINISGYITGSVQPKLNQSNLGKIKVKLPPVKEQKAIASILSTLDEKIKLNNQINKNLEEMAQAIFKYWFIDFEFPNKNGEPYKSSGGEMVESELGMIPKGWEVGTIGDIALNFKKGYKPTDIVKGTAYIGLEHIPRKCIALSSWETNEELLSNKYGFKQGDILFGKLRPYFHKVGIAMVDGVCSTDILVINSKKHQFYSYLLLNIYSDEFVNFTNAVSTGTKMPRVNWNDMAKYIIVVPPARIGEKYNKIIIPMLLQIRKNALENISLSQIRDTLLPKLMSGEIRVLYK